MNVGFLLFPGLLFLGFGLLWLQGDLVRMKHWLPGLLIPLVLLTITAILTMAAGSEEMTEILYKFGFLRHRWIVERSAPSLFVMYSVMCLFKYWRARSGKDKDRDIDKNDESLGR